MTANSNMKFSVRNYGPIAKAEGIDLRPLTVFVGPSNTGKSYLAILIYAFFRIFEGNLFLGGFRQERDYAHIDKMVRDFIKEEPRDIPFSDFPEELRNLIIEEVAQGQGQRFHREILRCMGISLREEDAPIENGFHLRIEGHEKNLILESSGRSATIKIEHLVFDDRRYIRLCKSLSDERKSPNGYTTYNFLEQALDALICSIIGNRGTESFYLPAARTGIMQSHRAIAAALVQRAPYAGVEGFSIPTLSGILSDFLKEIIELVTFLERDESIEKIADEMEKNILEGIIRADLSGETQYPQFLYKRNGVEIPLLRSSSMVTELAPIVLLIRYRVGKGDLLIIEEPESHLHPAAQRNMAGVIVRLIRAGVRVIVTTHSDYFLDQLGNHVLYSQILDKKNKPVNGKDIFLREEEIGAYSFQKKAKGTVVKPLPFDRETSFSPEDHSQVSSDLYNETVELLDEIESNE